MDATPLEIRRVEDRELHIAWADGHRTVFPNRWLRGHCQCATCVHELTGQRLLDTDAIRPDIKAVEISLVGRYAIQIRWSDGHSTVIYPFRKLREWCLCEACEKARAGQQA